MHVELLNINVPPLYLERKFFSTRAYKRETSLIFIGVFRARKCVIIFNPDKEYIKKSRREYFYSGGRGGKDHALFPRTTEGANLPCELLSLACLFRPSNVEGRWTDNF